MDRVDLDCLEFILSQGGIHGSDNQFEKFFSTTLTELVKKMQSELLENYDR